MYKIFILLLFGFVYLFSNQNNLNLTKEEMDYVTNNKKIKVHNEKDWTPINFYKNGQPQGYSVDYIKLLTSKVGLEIEFVTSDWNDLLNQAMNNKIDVMMNIAYTKNRAMYLNYVESYLENPTVIIGRKDSEIKDINSLFGKKVAVIEGFSDESLLMEKYPLIQKIVYKNSVDALKAVEYKQVDAALETNVIAKYLIKEHILSNLESKAEFDTGNPQDNKLFIATKKDGKILASILKKAMASLDEKEVVSIKDKWFFNTTVETLNLTATQKEWLKTNPIINFSIDPDWAPIEFINKDGKYEGLNADFLALISEISGIKFNLIPTKDWQESVKLSEENKTDMLACVSKTAKREEYLNFSNKTIELTDGVIMKNDSKPITNIEDLNGLKVGVPDGTSVHAKLKKENTFLKLVPIKGTKNAIEMLSNGEIGAYVGNLEVSGYYIQQLGLFNLKVVLKLPETRSMHLAIQKSFNPEALSVINKVIDSISQNDIQTIRQRWVGLKVTENTNYQLALKIGAILFLITLGIIYYNRKLKSAVNEKTSELSILLKSFDKNVIASRTDLSGKIIYVSDAFCEISGYSKDELIGKPHNIVRHPDMPKELFEELWNTIKNNRVWRGEVKNRKKDGSFYWTDAIISPEYDNKGKLVGYSGIRQDITAKKEVEELTHSLEEKVRIRTIDLENEKKFVNSVMNSQSNMVIATDGKTLKVANRAFLNFYSIENIEEFKEKFGNCICDTFVISDENEYLQKITKGKKWIEYVYDNQDLVHKTKILKDGKEHIFSITADKFEFNGETLLTSVFIDITQLENTKKDVVNSNLLMTQLLNSIPTPIFYKNELGEFIGFNKSYENIFGIDRKELLGKTVMDLEYLPLEDRKIYNNEDMDIIKNIGFLQREQDMIFGDSKLHNTIYSVNGFKKSDGTPGGLIGIFTDITTQKEMEKEVLLMHKHTRDSIEYASLIQHSLIPSNDLFREYFSDYLTIWHPKDIVGGDIYLFEPLRNEDECLLMIIDCTGHGVPGAFVTMLVKAIERQIIGYIMNNEDEEVSPSKILSIFNRSMKHLLQQEEETSISNVGFDGAILYYNKKDKIIKYSGANTALMYINDDELKTIKGDRHSVGYKKSNRDFIFTEHELEAKKGMSIFLSTDGYLDQNGGEKGFPFGKKRFESILMDNRNESFADIQEILMDSLAAYQGSEERNDDVTVIGLKI